MFVQRADIRVVTEPGTRTALALQPVPGGRIGGEVRGQDLGGRGVCLPLQATR